MSKTLIEQVLRQVIIDKHLHENTLRNGHVHQRENKFTGPMATLLMQTWPQVKTKYKFKANGYKNIDLVAFLNPSATGKKPVNILASASNVSWGLEAKHYSPHQERVLDAYLRQSLTGPVSDLLKLVDCGFSRIYILQLQTEVNNVTIYPGFNQNDILSEFPFLNYLLKTAPTFKVNMDRLRVGKWIDALVAYSKGELDKNLTYDYLSKKVVGTHGEVDINIHYLISGPFDRATLLPRLKVQGYDPDQHSCKERAVEEGTVLRTDVQIESDPAE